MVKNYCIKFKKCNMIFPEQKASIPLHLWNLAKWREMKVLSKVFLQQIKASRLQSLKNFTLKCMGCISPWNGVYLGNKEDVIPYKLNYIIRNENAYYFFSTSAIKNVAEILYSGIYIYFFFIVSFID